jgi:uncharacterized protein (DUF2141 family)
MKKLITTVAILGCINLFGANITVEVSNIKNANGKLGISIFNSSESFLDNKKTFRNKPLQIDDDTMIYTFKNVPNGVYAVTAFHDENDNGKMDRNFFGFPLEKPAISNIPELRGPPSFGDAKFKLTGDITIKLNLGNIKPN